MPATEQCKQQAEQAKQTHERRRGVIAGQVLQALGRPATLFRVEVRLLWDNHYRANLFFGADVVSTRIAHSFFVVADDDGNIVTSKPEITKTY